MYKFCFANFANNGYANPARPKTVLRATGREKNQPGDMRYLQDIATAYDRPFLIADGMDAF